MKQIVRHFHQYVSPIFTVEHKFKLYQGGRVTDGSSCPKVYFLRQGYSVIAFRDA
jgi:hypothetical protein